MPASATVATAYLHVRSNGDDGITVRQSADQGSSIVQHNTAQRNGESGIALHRGSVSHNVVDVNANGIDLRVGTASHNVVTRNVGSGLSLGVAASYIGNVLNGNGINVTASGKNLGQNLCGTTVCPGAKF